MRLVLGAALASLVMVVTAGCGSGDDAPPPPAAAAVTSSVAPAARVALAAGDTFDQYEGTGVVAELDATITLMSVEVDPVCEYRDPTDQTDAPKGRAHHVALELTVDATGPVRPGFINAPSFDISEQLPGGFTSTSAAHSTERYSCLPGRPVVDTVDAGTKVRGWMLFAVENASGSLLWQNGGDSTGVTIAYAPSPTAPATAAAPGTTAPAAPASTRPAAAPKTTAECIGYGCSAEQDAELGEQEAAANDDYGAGCNYKLCGSDLPENQPGYGDPGQSSGENQLEYGCQQGYIVGPECDGY